MDSKIKKPLCPNVSVSLESTNVVDYWGNQGLLTKGRSEPGYSGKRAHCRQSVGTSSMKIEVWNMWQEVTRHLYSEHGTSLQDEPDRLLLRSISWRSFRRIPFRNSPITSSFSWFCSEMGNLSCFIPSDKKTAWATGDYQKVNWAP